MEYPSPPPHFPAEPASAPGGPQVSQEILHSLAQCRPWMRFCMVLGYIAAGFMWLIGLLVVIGSIAGTWIMLPIGLLYAALGFPYFLPARSLSRSASTISRLLESGSPDHLESALEEQRRFWKLIGILACLGFAIWIISIAGMMYYTVGRNRF